MHDTVTKLLDYAEGYARAYRGSTYERHAARQALQDELTLLFTPQDPAVVGLAIHMEEHGITGEKNAQAT